MIYNKERIDEAIFIYDEIATAKRMGAKTVEVSDVMYEENIKSLQNIGYLVTMTANGIKIEWKEN